MSGRTLILSMSVSMDGFAGRDHADQRHRLVLAGAPETEGESRWES